MFSLALRPSNFSVIKNEIYFISKFFSQTLLVLLRWMISFLWIFLESAVIYRHTFCQCATMSTCEERKSFTFFWIFFDDSLQCSVLEEHSTLPPLSSIHVCLPLTQPWFLHGTMWYRVICDRVMISQWPWAVLFSSEYLSQNANYRFSVFHRGYESIMR